MEEFTEICKKGFTFCMKCGIIRCIPIERTHKCPETGEMECCKMAKPNTKKKKKENNAGKRVLDVILSLALIAGVGFGGYHVVTNGSFIDQTTTYQLENSETEPTEPTTEEPKIIFQNEEYLNLEVYNGPLMLVNFKEPFRGTEDDLVSLYEVKLEADSHSFSVRDAELLVRRRVADQLIVMFDDFFNETYDDNLLVLSGYRSKERQQELYDEDLAQTGLTTSERVAKAGYSEHQTGYCVDLSLIGGDYDGSGIYSWINEHCYEYGFVLRYPEEKTPVTEIQYEPWHYRYVGAPHAFFMTSGRLCLEEYMQLLKVYPYDGEHLVITDSDGKIYEVYYVAASTDFNTTMVPVPAGLSYEVSGNNSDGFIVTVDTGETGEAPVLSTNTPAATEEPSEDSSTADESTEE